MTTKINHKDHSFKIKFRNQKTGKSTSFQLNGDTFERPDIVSAYLGRLFSTDEDNVLNNAGITEPLGNELDALLGNRDGVAG